jgi:hypothetical protein
LNLRPRAKAIFAFCPWLKAHFSEVILIVVIDRFFLNQIQLNWIQTDDLERDSTLFTIHCLAFVHVEINVDVGVAFRTGSGRHFFYLQ